MKLSKHRLAIIIPAYKARFFEETLNSIASQTCQDFTLYIGDDASPEDLFKIMETFQGRIDIVYKRFKDNLGKDDLVGHWNRCIDLTNGENWLWLFSDDDIMDENCVEQFYNYISLNKEVELLHFNVDVIDKNTKTIKVAKPFPSVLTPSEFFRLRIKFEIYSLVIDYIFKRSLFLDKGGFQRFDLAWNSDDATWIKFSLLKNIRTINGAKVKWRYSSLNISSQVEDKKIVIRKMKSNLSYLKWARLYFDDNQISDDTTDFQKLKWIMVLLIETSSLSKQERNCMVRVCLRELNFASSQYIVIQYIKIGKFKKTFKQMFKRIFSYKFGIEPFVQ